VDCIVDCEQAVRGFGREYFFSTFQSARGRAFAHGLIPSP
jgi:hypothetical protein